MSLPPVLNPSRSDLARQLHAQRRVLVVQTLLLLAQTVVIALLVLDRI